MKKKRLLLSLLSLGLLSVLGFFVYRTYFAPTRVALVHFPSYQVSNLIHANEGCQVKVETVDEANAAKLASSFDVILIQGAGYRPTPEEQKALQRASEKGVPIYCYVMRSESIQSQNITPEQEQQLDLYYQHRNQHNNKHLLRYLRAELDAHKLFSVPAEAPEILPESFFYHLEGERTFATAKELTQYLKDKGLYHEGAPRIALLSGTLPPMQGSRAHIDYLIQGMMNRGYNVYPFVSSEQRTKILSEINPSGVIYLPMGRLEKNDGDIWLSEHNVPLFCPLPINQTEHQWLADPIGLTAGSLTARISLPELDGGILPHVVATEEEAENNQLISVVPQKEGAEFFMDGVHHYLSLREKKNSEKHLAVVYFRGAGQQSLVATGLEVIPSLYNFLKRLQSEGYNVSGLPTTLEGFSSEIKKRGAVWGAHSESEWQRFIKEEHPEVIPVKVYEAWAKEILTPEKYQEVIAQYGKAPGTYLNTTSTNNDPAIAVARLRYGNIVILPQQASSYTEDHFKMVHGVEVPPPHSYLAPYLWIQKGFKADALVHFGTHGNLEFTPGKQVALSHLDWAKVLVGSTPHFYYYSISNVGESVIAKRRGHAATISYLTPPFLESNTREAYRNIQDLLEEARLGKDVGLKLKKECTRLKIHEDLQLDGNTEIPYNEEELQTIENYIEEIAQEKVTGKLYTLGEPYTSEEIDGSVIAMGADALAYLWARVDKQNGKITQQQYENRSYVSKNYLRPITHWMKHNKGNNDPTSLLRMIGANVQHGDSVSLALLEDLKREIDDLMTYRQLLMTSPQAEMDALIKGLNGGYISPGPGGDAVRSPNALPTGRNLYSINAEITPTEKAWNTGKALAEQTLNTYKEKHGAYPTKVSYTFWAGEFIESEGATIAQALAMIGVEPIRDRHQRVIDLRLIPANELGRPRIDVVVQVSGQLRDLATSRLMLLHRAIEMASNAKEDVDNNYIRQGSLEIERKLIEKGTPPEQARNISTMRLFGGLNGRYGTGIKELVENGSEWESKSDIAATYLKNMGAIYGTEESWGEYHEHLLEVALDNTQVVVQPRQNNTWGALSLDHMYEFMGGISNAVEEVTGQAPEMYLADYRNRYRARMQGLKEAIGVESRTTIFNPSYIKEKMKGGASSANTFAKTIRNSYGWEAMRSDALEDSYWNRVFEVYVEDSEGLGIQEYFEKVNPSALQEITAVMLETSRKGMWKATDEQIIALAELHGELTIKYGASGSEFSDANTKLQEYITQHIPQQSKEYQAAMKEGSSSNQKSLVLEQEKLMPQGQDAQVLNGLLVAIAAIVGLLLVLILIMLKRKRSMKRN